MWPKIYSQKSSIPPILYPEINGSYVGDYNVKIIDMWLENKIDDDQLKEMICDKNELAIIPPKGGTGEI